jgi:RNA polymerase sigma-70 factor (ECF subfamily)
MMNGQGYSVRDLMDQDSDPPTLEPGDGELLERFIEQHDESAFAALVRRHGPMVLGVCRRVLNDWQRAEDAFQVTFLVLARKAESLTRPELLANWLHGVAYRIALKARSHAARQRAHERHAAEMLPTESQPTESARELREVLDQELDHLPEKYRAPLVLCYLEGKTNEEAARLLNCPIGSMSNRLARGRGLLRSRLTRHGLVFDLRFCSRFLAQHELPPTTVPPELETLTVQSALSFAREAEHSVTHELPLPVAELVEEALRSPDGRRPRRLLLLVLAALLITTGLAVLAWWLWSALAGQKG